jgi:hypothetical protein
MRWTVLTTLLTLAPGSGRAEGDEVDSLVRVRTQGSTIRLRAGESGTLRLSLDPAPGAHVSREAPLKVQLSSAQASFERSRLTLADATLDGEGAHFEVGFTPTAQGPISLEASVSFFACTATTCARQSRTVSLAVEVR